MIPIFYHMYSNKRFKFRRQEFETKIGIDHVSRYFSLFLHTGQIKRCLCDREESTKAERMYCG